MNHVTIDIGMVKLPIKIPSIKRGSHGIWTAFSRNMGPQKLSKYSIDQAPNIRLKMHPQLQPTWELGFCGLVVSSGIGFSVIVSSAVFIWYVKAKGKARCRL